jgi:hypothetical protein
MAASPKVSRIVLFKHGVAYLERGGPADGDFDLSFKQDEMNDVLKSLSVWVAKGEGRVGSISFEAPADPEEALAKRKLILGEGRALLDLVQSLRGRRIAIGETSQRVEGEVIGVERVEGGDGGERRSLVLRTAAGTLALRDLASLGEVQLLDEVSTAPRRRTPARTAMCASACKVRWKTSAWPTWCLHRSGACRIGWCARATTSC